MRQSQDRIGRWALGAGGLAAAIIWALGAQATTRQGINFEVSVHPIPLHAKVLAFLHRDAQYRLITREIAGGLRSDRERVQAAFDWTRRRIRRTPQGWPVVDDHVLHIIIRGHGMDDQMADVFTTISTYAGVPAFWRFIREAPEDPGLVLSFAKVDGAWRVFDVANGVVFRDFQGQLVDIESLLATPVPVELAIPNAPSGIPYAAYVERLQPFTVPDPLRAEKQMPWPRLAFELRRTLHLTSDDNAESG